MTDQPNKGASEASEASEASTISETPGALLKAAREKRGLQQAGVAERLRLSVQTIIDLENDDYTHFTAEIYLRGHIRSFARLVNLDENKALECYESMGMVFETDNNERLLSSQTVPVSARTRRSKRRALMWTSFTVLLILVVMVALWWQEQKHHVFPSLSGISQSVNMQTISIKTAATKPRIQKPKIISHTVSLVAQKKKVPVRVHSKRKTKPYVPDYRVRTSRG